MSRRHPKKPPQGNFTASIKSFSHDGRGIAAIDGKTTFIFGALPGETVEFTYTACHSKFDEGKVVNVITPAPERVTPNCQHFGVCGGCSLQHIASTTQIKHKQTMLLEQLKHFGNIVPKEILSPLTSDVWGYRHKARLGVRYVTKKATVLVGFREQNSNFLAQLERCEVLDPRVGNLIMPLREFIASLDAFNSISQIEVAITQTQVGLVFRHLEPLNSSDLEQLKTFGAEHGLWLYLQPAGPNSVTKLYPDDKQLFLHYSLPEFNLIYQFHPLDFTQVNPTINQKMVALALELLDVQPSDTVLDLFCGLGNFTLPIAQRAKHVVGVEGSDVMVERASMNAQTNHITNVEFYAANLMGDCSTHPWTTQSFTKILLDPPRSGALDILPLVAAMNAQTIVYVSCNPATLARDAGELVNRYGYTLQKAGVMDMFPHTEHVESIALFCKDTSW